MLQNARVTAFTISELLRENQQGGKLPNYRKYDVIIMPQVISIKSSRQNHKLLIKKI